MRSHAELGRWILLYWLIVFPRAARELRRWRLRAEAIPDPVLRDQALAKLAHERLHADGAAAFAILAARRHRTDVVAACVAFEVMYDYLDALTEAHPTLDNNRRLHRALPDAFGAEPAHPDYYAHHLRRADGGYLDGLVTACRTAFARLPAHAAVRPQLTAATERAREAQSLNHAAPELRPGWASAQCAEARDLCWWEITAAAASPLGIFALVAAASHARTSATDAQALEHAYFPWVGALDWLMENLVDRVADAHAGAPNYLSHYASDADAARRLTALAAQASARTGALHDGARQQLMLAGMVALHVSHVPPGDPSASETAHAAQAAVGHAVAPFLWVLWLRRLIDRRRRHDAPAAGAAPAPEPARRRRSREGARR